MCVPWSSVFVLACLLSAVPVCAQTVSSTPTTSDPQAVALVQKSLAALTGGVAVTDVMLTGSARRIAGSDDETGSAILKATSVGDSRVELKLSSGDRIEIRNHSALPLAGTLPPSAPAAAQEPQPVGAWSGPDGVLHPIGGNDLLTDPSWFFPPLTLERISAANWVLAYSGQVTFENKALLEISAVQQFPTVTGALIANVLQHLSQLNLYFDPSTLLPVFLVFDAHPDTNFFQDVPTEIFFSNYQTVGAAAIPLHVQKYIHGGLAIDLQLSNAAVNSGLPATDFALQ